MSTRIVTVWFLLLAMVLAAAAHGQQADPAQTAQNLAAQSSPAPRGQPAAPAPQPGTAAPAKQEPSLLKKGIAHYDLGEYEEALDQLKKARAAEPASPLAAYYLGMTCKKMEDFTASIAHLKEATTLQPPVREAFVELADAYYAVGRNDDALQAVEVAEREGIAPAQTAFLRGLVLMKKQRYADAAMSFEKAKSLDPKLTIAAEYQIATIYRQQGRTADALNIYQSIAAKDPESPSGEMAKQQVEILSSKPEKKKELMVTADVMYQYDSNVILKPDAAAAAASISGESDSSVAVTARAEYAPELRAPYGLNLQYALYLNRHQDLTAYDLMSHTLSVAPTYRIGQNTAQVQFAYNYLLVDNEKYLQAAGITPQYSFVTGDDHYAQVLARYVKKDYLMEAFSPDENRDGSDVAAGLSWFLLVAEKKGYVNLRYELNKESTTGENWSYMGHRLVAATLYPVAEGLQGVLSVEAYRQDYDNVHTVFDTKRTDTNYTLNVQALYAITRNVDLHAQYLYIKNDSSIDVYGYTKSIYGIGIYAKF